MSGQDGDRQIAEDRLFERIAMLVKLENLALHADWDYSQPLDNNKWKTLSDLETLQYLELGQEYIVRMDKSTEAGISTLRALREFRVSLPWMHRPNLNPYTNNQQVNISTRCDKYRFDWSQR